MVSVTFGGWNVEQLITNCSLQVHAIFCVQAVCCWIWNEVLLK